MRHNVYNAKLGEMFVKSESLFYLQAINYCIADAIGKTPFFVAKLFKNAPSSLDIGFIDPNKLG